MTNIFGSTLYGTSTAQMGTTSGNYQWVYNQLQNKIFYHNYPVAPTTPEPVKDTNLAWLDARIDELRVKL